MPSDASMQGEEKFQHSDGKLLGNSKRQPGPGVPGVESTNKKLVKKIFTNKMSVIKCVIEMRCCDIDCSPGAPTAASQVLCGLQPGWNPWGCVLFCLHRGGFPSTVCFLISP